MKTTFNLLQLSHDVFTGEVVKKISYDLNEAAAGVQTALEVIIPVVLYGLSVKASTRFGADEIAQRATTAYSQGVLEKVGFLPLQNSGAYLFLLSDTFGFKSGGIINSISALSSLKHPSVSSLMSLAVPAVLALLGKHKESNGTGERGLAALLIFHSNSFIKDLPLDLNLNNSADDNEKKATAVNSIKEKKSGLQGRRTRVLMIVTFGALLGWLFISGKSNHNAATAANGKDTVQSEAKKDSVVITKLLQEKMMSN